MNWYGSLFQYPISNQGIFASNIIKLMFKYPSYSTFDDSSSKLKKIIKFFWFMNVCNRFNTLINICNCWLMIIWTNIQKIFYLLFEKCSLFYKIIFSPVLTQMFTLEDKWKKEHEFKEFLSHFYFCFLIDVLLYIPVWFKS